MIKPVRRPIIWTISLLITVGLIYSISGSSNDVQGMVPINLNRKTQDYGLKNQIPQSNPNQGESDENIVAPKIGDGYSEETLLDNNKEIDTNHNEEEVPQNGKPDQVPVKVSEDQQAETNKNANKEQSNKDKVELSKDAPQEVQNLGGLSTDFTETPFMPKMANETLKAQLGNSAWRLFHTILARYPENPSQQEQSTLGQYIQLFAQVYPCGDCARHFQGLLKKYPPQTRNRKTAALWGCHVHNKVNERLGKPEYDCTHILEDYDCGCGSDEQEEDSTLANKSLNNLKKVDLQEEQEQLGG